MRDHDETERVLEEQRRRDVGALPKTRNHGRILHNLVHLDQAQQLEKFEVE